MAHFRNRSLAIFVLILLILRNNVSAFQHPRRQAHGILGTSKKASIQSEQSVPTEVQHLLPKQQTSQRAIDILRKDGCVVLDGLLNTHQVSKLDKDLNLHFGSVESCQGNFYGHDTKRVGGLFTKSDVCRTMATIPIILNVMDAFLLPEHTSAYQINLSQAISIGPGEVNQIIHQDDPMFPFLHSHHEVMINCMWAVDDFTMDNGATRVIPGSHLWSREQALALDTNDPPDLTQAEMKKGSVLIYLGSLFHGGRANKTQFPRRGVVISYNLGWLRQAENSYLAYSLDEMRQMEEPLQRLLGYFVHEPNLGSVNGVDPIHYLRGDVDQQIFTEYIPDQVQPIIEQYREDQKRKL